MNYKLYNMNGQRYYSMPAGTSGSLRWTDTQMDPKQLAWIDTALQGGARKTGRSAISIIRCIRTRTATVSSVDLRVLLEPIFIKRGVNVVFSAADHVYERVKPQNRIYYSSRDPRDNCEEATCRRRAETAAYFDQDQSFHARGDRGRSLYFQVIFAYREDGRFRCDRTADQDRRARAGAAARRSSALRTRRTTLAENPTNDSERHAANDANEKPRNRRGWRSTVPRLSRFAVEHLLLLPLGAVIALLWVNTRPESYYRFTYAIAFAVNDVAMMLFFAVMTKEVVEATAPAAFSIPSGAPCCRSSPRSAPPRSPR